jgi:hypothetical protein
MSELSNIITNGFILTYRDYGKRVHVRQDNRKLFEMR